MLVPNSSPFWMYIIWLRFVCTARPTVCQMRPSVWSRFAYTMTLDPFGVGCLGSMYWPSLMRPGVFTILLLQSAPARPFPFVTLSELGSPPLSGPGYR